MVFPCMFFLYLAVGEQMQMELEQNVSALSLTPEKQVHVRFKEFIFVLVFCIKITFQFFSVLKRTKPSTLLWCGIVVGEF